jgi:RHS repeat-associated protein
LRAGVGVRNPQSLGWDVFDRMTQATANGSTTNYKYDAFGRRVAQQTPNGTNWFFYDMSGRLLVTYPWMNGYQPVRTAYFAGQRVGQYSDRVGSVRNTNGGIGSHYYPFGEEITSTANDRYKFAETFRDADSGLDYALNRYYAASIGRFLSVDAAQADPVRPQSFNRYAYARNDPLNLRDRAGRFPCWVDDSNHDWGTTDCTVHVIDGGPEYAAVRGAGSLPEQVPIWKPRVIDSETNKQMRKKLGDTVGALSSNCVKAVTGITGQSMATVKEFGASLNFYDATPSSKYANVSQDDVSGNGNSTTLAGTFAGSADPVAKTIYDAQSPAVLIGVNFAGRDPDLQGGILVHETLHAVMSTGDDGLFNALLKCGLVRSDPFGTEEISEWFKNGCPKQH